MSGPSRGMASRRLDPDAPWTNYAYPEWSAFP